MESDILRLLNEIGEAWSRECRDQHRKPIASRFQVDLFPEPRAVLTKDGLMLPITIVNHSKGEITTRLSQEPREGKWPITDLYTSVSGVQKEASFEPVFLKRESGTPQEVRLTPGQSITMHVPMDWTGTDVQPRTAFMDSSRFEYHVRLLVVFSLGHGADLYAASALQRVTIDPK